MHECNAICVYYGHSSCTLMISPPGDVYLMECDGIVVGNWTTEMLTNRFVWTIFRSIVLYIGLHEEYMQCLTGVDGWMGACNVELMSGQWGQCRGLVEVKCRMKSADKEWFEQMSAWVNGKGQCTCTWMGHFCWMIKQKSYVQLNDSESKIKKREREKYVDAVTVYEWTSS